MMTDILAYGGSHQPHEWTTEARSQFCSFAFPPPTPPAPPEQIYYQQAAAPPSLPAAPVTQMIPVPGMGWIAQPVPPAEPAQTAEAATAADATVDSKAPADTKETARPRSARTSPKRSARSARTTPRNKRPPFHTYGRANVKPVVGGFLYGDYLATHNANAGASLPLSRRKPAADMGPAQVHYMEADMRQSAPEPVELESVGACAGGPAPVAPAPPTIAPPIIPAPAPAPVRSGPDPYAGYPAYDPSKYISPPSETPITLPYYPVPLGSEAQPAPRPMTAESYAAPWNPTASAASATPFWSPFQPAAPAPTAPSAGAAQPLMAPPPGLVPFVPDLMGERLDPRRFKYAPRNAMDRVPAAGQRSVRRDNLGPI